MYISDTLKKYQAVEVELLLAHLLNKPKEFLYLHPRQKLTPTQTQKLLRLVRRRTKGEPIAYIVGYKDFFGLRFTVTKDTLIPRPETEWLVEKILAMKVKIGSRILDVGTGSGIIAISVAKHLKGRKVRITASDISNTALTVARQNARAHHVKITFIQSDLFATIQGAYDIIIANLPYVPYSDYKKLKNSLRYEPKNAITDGTDSFQIYKRFFDTVQKHLSPKGIILLEIDPKTKKSIERWTKQYLPGITINFYKDLHKLWRYAEIQSV